jgi:hypothetical protein
MGRFETGIEPEPDRKEGLYSVLWFWYYISFTYQAEGVHVHLPFSYILYRETSFIMCLERLTLLYLVEVLTKYLIMESSIVLQSVISLIVDLSHHISRYACVHARTHTYLHPPSK